MHIAVSEGHRWIPANRSNERGYAEFENSRAKWMWLDGEWRETRNPAMEEVKKKSDGETQTLGFGEFEERTYVGVFTYNLKYVGYIMNEGRQDRLALKKSTEWIMQKEEAVIVEVERLPAVDRSGCGEASTVG